MRMNKNKGYSLVELLISLAIFSLIMIGIITIMRTTSITYKDGVEEAAVQEEAQIAANQISDLLIDAKDMGAHNDSEHSYNFTNQEGKAFTVRYDAANDKVLYTVEGDSTDHVLAENVSEFKIDGCGKAINADNKVVVTLGVTRDGASYSSTKEVSFRNNIEDFDFNSLANVGGFTSTPTPNTNKITVLRYDEVDLTAEYGLISDVSLNTEAQKWFVNFVNEDGSSNTSVVQTCNKDSKTKNSVHYILKLNKGVNTDLSKRIPEAAAQAEVTGKNYNDEVVTYQLLVDPVSFDRNKDVYVCAYDTNTNDGYGTVIRTEGININKACADPDLTVQYKTTLVYGGNSKSTNFIDLGYLSGTSLQKPQSFNNLDFAEFGLSANPNSNGLVVVKGNSKISDKSNNDTGRTVRDTKKKKLKFTLKIGSTEYDLTYKFLIEGYDNLSDFN